MRSFPVAPASAAWRKSSHSAEGNDACVEVAPIAPVIAVRDSVDPTGPALAFSPAVWNAFTARVRTIENA
ncbi:DUF397 domain-containing protein [Actinomadura parmotrematis]|uniref:DUF397 domain-containing protein n=1 Tax=Actinomadura parmotrematis TaxID=2864039 RepID=A0ABS7FR66_9ACTN|nr:DUF397 domain-containing protein [Actinomadura parmotrematis]MBW8482879.1 DUF397 domain-containing protein [Actinomadura parmotrematis]